MPLKRSSNKNRRSFFKRKKKAEPNKSGSFTSSANEVTPAPKISISTVRDDSGIWDKNPTSDISASSSLGMYSPVNESSKNNTDNELSKLVITQSRGTRRGSVSLETTRSNRSHISLKKPEGFFSSIVTAAHNAANMLSHSRDNTVSAETLGPVDEKLSFGKRLDNLLKSKNIEKPSSHSSIADKSGNTNEQTHETEHIGESTNLVTGEGSTFQNNPTFNIHFSSIRESPVNTMGKGNLSLDDFLDKSTSQSILPHNISLERLDSHRKLMSVSPQNSASIGKPSYSLHNPEKFKGRQRAPSRAGSMAVSSQKGLDINLSDNISQISSISDDLHASLTFAGDKNNKEFHEVFKQIPRDEKLIESFSCALNKDILVQGRIYLSEKNICFNSNILGWVTNLVIPLQEVIQIEKKTTAVLFPNGIVVQTLHEKYVFATFLSRDVAFESIKEVWQAALTGTSAVHNRSSASISESKGEDSELPAESSNTPYNVLSSAEADSTPETSIENSSITSDSEKEVAYEENNLLEAQQGSPANDENIWNGIAAAGPLTHGKVDVEYQKDSSDIFICDEDIKAPLGVVCQLIFGKDTSRIIQLIKDQKNFDISENDIVPLLSSNDKRSYSYVKPLSGPIGPKQTKCLITERLVEYDLDHHAMLEQRTQTPDVPSGNSFSIRTKLYFSWSSNNSTKVYVLTAVEWTGRSWIKGAIERGSIDGQKESIKDLIKGINEMIKSSSKSPTKVRKKRGRVTSVTPKDVNEVPVSPPELSIKELFSQLIEKLAKKTGVPYFKSILLVSVSLCSLFFFYSLFLTLFGSHKPYGYSKYIIRNVATKVNINNNDFYLVPFTETYLEDQTERLKKQRLIWDWISEKSNGKLKVKNADVNWTNSIKTNADVDEILRLAEQNIENRRHSLL